MIEPPAQLGDRAVGRPCLAVAYDITSASPLELATLIGSWCDLVWVADLEDPALGPLAKLLPRLGSVIDTARTSVEAVPGLLHAEGVGGVVAFSDTGLDLAATLGGALGLPSNPAEVVQRLLDKVAQRKALDVAGVEVPPFVEIEGGQDAEQVAKAVQDLRFPLVVKPIRGAGSRDTCRARDLEHLRTLLGPGGIFNRSLAGTFIIEEYLPDRVPLTAQPFGDYVSVEIVVQAGRPVPVAVTGKFPLMKPFRETGNFMPHILDIGEVTEVLALSRAAVEAIGVVSGAVHAEIKMTPHGPRVIEVNGRVGGGGIDAMFSRTHGRSLTEVAAQIALGQSVELEAEIPAQSSGPFAYEYFLQPPMSATRLRSVLGIDRIPGTAGAIRVAAGASPGDSLDWRNGSQGYILHVTGTAPDRDALATVPSEINRVVDVSYD